MALYLLIPLLPLLASLILLLGGRRWGENSHRIGIPAIGLSFGLSVATHDQQNHRKSKQGNDGEKTIISRLSYHVTGGIHMHNPTYPCDQEQKQNRQLVNEQSEINGQGTRLKEAIKRKSKWSISQHFNKSGN